MATESAATPAATDTSLRLLLLLCNEPMRKRCQLLADAATRSGLLTTRLKCVTYVEEAAGVLFSFSEKTDRLLADTDLVLCLLRVSSAQPKTAWRQLLDMLAARHPRFKDDSLLVLVQCCGSEYWLHHTGSNGGGANPVSSSGFVDFQLRDWLASRLGCRCADLASGIGIENTTAGKALRHRLLARRYTVQVEFSQKARRHSLYRLTGGREAGDGGCSPAAVAKRCLSMGEGLQALERVDPAARGGDGYYGRGDELQLFRLDSQEDETAADAAAAAAAAAAATATTTLVISGSKSCAKEAALCLNNLVSRGHRAVTLAEFAAAALGQQGQLSWRHRWRGASARRLLTRVLKRLSPTAAASAVFLLFCRGPQSRLLDAFMRSAGSTAESAAAPRACFVVLTGPVTDEECRQLRERGHAVTIGCQLDVVCCQAGLSGGRVLECLTPGLVSLMRQLETHHNNSNVLGSNAS